MAQLPTIGLTTPMHLKPLLQRVATTQSPSRTLQTLELLFLALLTSQQAQSPLLPLQHHITPIAVLLMSLALMDMEKVWLM